MDGQAVLTGDDFVLYRESWERSLQTRGAVLPGRIVFGIPSPTSVDDRW